MQQQALASALGRWVQLRSDVLLARRVLGRLHSIRLGQCWSSWLAALDMWKHEAELTRMEAELEAQRMRAAERILQRWKLQGMTKCFSSWVDLMVLKRRLRTMMKRLEMGGLCAAFEGWCDAVATVREHRAVVSRVLARMQHMAQASALVRWSEHTKFIVRSRSIVQRLLCRWMMQSVSRAFAAWQSWVSEKARQQRVLSKVLSRLEHGGLASAFGGWHDAVLVVRSHRNVLLRFVQRMALQSVSRAFNRWFDFSAEMRRARGVLLDLQNMWINFCWSGWVDAVHLWKVERARAENEAALAAAKSELAAQQTRAAEKILRRWKMQGVSKCFSSWLDAG